jgi:hypothetical protein
MLVPDVTDLDLKKLLPLLECSAPANHIDFVSLDSVITNECFPNVERQVKNHGGSCIFGWQIWKTSLLIEAEFHAVWKSPEGLIYDITPKAQPVQKILFVSDPNKKYEGKQVNNIRVNITKNPIVDEMIEVYNAVFRIENQGARAFQHQLSLQGKEAAAHQRLTAAKQLLEVMALHGQLPKSPCACGSGKKYKVCHGKKIRKLLGDF